MVGQYKTIRNLGGRSFSNRMNTIVEGCFEQLLIVIPQPQIHSNYSVLVVVDNGRMDMEIR